MTTPAKLKLKIIQGASYRKHLTWLAPDKTTPIDLTSCTARMQVHANIAAAAASDVSGLLTGLDTYDRDYAADYTAAKA